MDTLYITDLDGTLLHSDGKLSDKSYNILQPLIDNGLKLVVATGRTRDNALAVIKPLEINMPIIFDNGTFIYDTKEKKFLLKSTINKDSAIRAVEMIGGMEINPFINTLSGNLIYVFHSDLKNDAQKSYYSARSIYGLSKYIKDTTYTEYLNYDVFNISTLEKYSNIIDLYNELKKDSNINVLMFPSHYYEEYYWLEVLPANSGKGKALDILRDIYKPKKIVCFGDNLNDLCMFEKADLCIAPENAVDDVKKKTDIIIGHCDEDSVALYLRDNIDKT